MSHFEHSRSGIRAIEGNPYIVQRRMRISAEPQLLSASAQPVSPTRKNFRGSGYPKLSSYSPVLEKRRTPKKIALTRMKYLITGCELKTDPDGYQYTAYAIQTHSGSSILPFTVKRRYSQFSKFRDDLIAFGSNTGAHFAMTKISKRTSRQNIGGVILTQRC